MSAAIKSIILTIAVAVAMAETKSSCCNENKNCLQPEFVCTSNEPFSCSTRSLLSNTSNRAILFDCLFATSTSSHDSRRGKNLLIERLIRMLQADDDCHSFKAYCTKRIESEINRIFDNRYSWLRQRQVLSLLEEIAYKSIEIASTLSGIDDSENSFNTSLCFIIMATIHKSIQCRLNIQEFNFIQDVCKYQQLVGLAQCLRRCLLLANQQNKSTVDWFTSELLGKNLQD